MNKPVKSQRAATVHTTSILYDTDPQVQEIILSRQRGMKNRMGEGDWVPTGPGAVVSLSFFLQDHSINA